MRSCLHPTGGVCCPRIRLIGCQQIAPAFVLRPPDAWMPRPPENVAQTSGRAMLFCPADSSAKDTAGKERQKEIQFGRVFRRRRGGRKRAPAFVAVSRLLTMATTNVLFPRPASATEAAARGATAPVLAIRHAAQPTTMLRVLLDNGLVTGYACQRIHHHSEHRGVRCYDCFSHHSFSLRIRFARTKPGKCSLRVSGVSSARI